MRTEQLSSEGLNKFIFPLEYYESTQSYCLFLSDEYEICDCHFKLTYFLFSFALFFPLSFCPCIPAGALESLRQSCESVCPNDGFLEQVILTLH